MNRRSPILFALLLLLTSLVTISCGDSEESDGPTLRFAHFWSEPSQRAFLEARVDAFKSSNPGVEVELIDLSWGDGKEKLFAMFDGGETPDVIELGSDWVAQFAESGRLHEFTNSASSVPPALAAPGIWNGKTYALPWVVASRGLFINTTMLKDAGVDPASLGSWEELLQGVEKINASLGAESKAYGLGVNGADRNRLYKKVLPLVWTNGGALFNEAGEPTLNAPANVEALEFYLTLARNGKIDVQKELDQLFLAGRLGIWLSGPWLVDRIAKENPELAYDVQPMPSFNGREGVGIIGGEYLAVNKDSDNLELAIKLAEFLVSAPEALALSKDLKGGFAPADQAESDDPYLNEGVQKAFTAQLATGRMTPVHPKWLEIQDLFENAIERAIEGEVSAADALAAAQEKALKSM